MKLRHQDRVPLRRRLLVLHFSHDRSSVNNFQRLLDETRSKPYPYSFEWIRKEKEKKHLTKNSRNLNQISRAFLSLYFFPRGNFCALFAWREPVRDYLFESRFFRVHRPRGIPGRELKYDRPADLHRFSPHTWRQLGDDRCYHSRWYLRETDGPSSSSSLIDLDFLPCAKRDINTFYLYLRTNDCEKGEREREKRNEF